MKLSELKKGDAFIFESGSAEFLFIRFEENVAILEERKTKGNFRKHGRYSDKVIKLD